MPFFCQPINSQDAWREKDLDSMGLTLGMKEATA
jgi:hypothetical protein